MLFTYNNRVYILMRYHYDTGLFEGIDIHSELNEAEYMYPFECTY